MKKFLYTVLLAVSCLCMASCDNEFLGDKDPVGGTAVEKISGEWYGHIDAVDAEGNVVYEDPYGMGNFILLTYNTAANKATEMWVSDQGQFWDFIVKVNVNDYTFTTNGPVENASYECNVTLTNGKVTPMGGTQNNGSKSDCIEFEIAFDDDDPAANGFDHYKFSGIRYSGLAEND